MPDQKHIQIYDTTLRDGCQSEDVSLTTPDKVHIAHRLDDLGIDYIEGGWPGSNERDAAFFKEIKKVRLHHAKVAAFGSTRRSGVRASADRNLQLLLRAETNNDVFADAGLSVAVLLGVQVDGAAAVGNLGEQFRGPCNILFPRRARPAAVFRKDAQV